MKSSTPVVESLTYRGATSGAYSVTNGSTTSIYVKKSEAYDNLGVLEFLKDSYNGFTVTWKDEFVSSLPSGYKTATQVFSPGTANTAQVLTGYTFSSANGTNLSGTMANRGNLNWSPSGSSSYSVPAGYYSGGTLNSSGAYNSGYNNGVNAGVDRNSIAISHYSRGTACDNSTSSESNYTVSNLAAGTYLVILSYYTGSYSYNYDTSKLNASLTFSGGSILKTLSWNDFSSKQSGHAAYIIHKVKFSSGSNSTRFTAYGVGGFTQDIRRIIIKL